MYPFTLIPVDLELIGENRNGDQLSDLWELSADKIIAGLVQEYGIVKLFLYLALGPFLWAIITNGCTFLLYFERCEAAFEI